MDTAREEEETILALLEFLPDYFRYFHNFTEVKELQITKTQLRILLILGVSDSLSMGQLAERLCISREQTTRALAPLIRKQFVMRNIHDTNRRQTDVWLTNSGIRFLSEVKSRYIQHFTSSLSRLTDEEKQCFASSVRNILHLMKKMTPSDS